MDINCRAAKRPNKIKIVGPRGYRGGGCDFGDISNGNVFMFSCRDQSKSIADLDRPGFQEFPIG